MNDLKRMHHPELPYQHMYSHWIHELQFRDGRTHQLKKFWGPFSKFRESTRLDVHKKLSSRGEIYERNLLTNYHIDGKTKHVKTVSYVKPATLSTYVG